MGMDEDFFLDCLEFFLAPPLSFFSADHCFPYETMQGYFLFFSSTLGDIFSYHAQLTFFLLVLQC